MRNKKLRVLYLVFVALAIVVYFLRPGIIDHGILDARPGPQSRLFATSYVLAVLFEFALSRMHIDVVLVLLPLFLICVKRISDNSELSLVYLFAFFLFSSSIIYNSVFHFNRFVNCYDDKQGNPHAGTKYHPYTGGLNVIDGPNKNIVNYFKFVGELPILYYGTEDAERPKVVGFDRLKPNYSPAMQMKTMFCLFLYVFLFFLFIYCAINYEGMRFSFRL